MNVLRLLTYISELYSKMFMLTFFSEYQLLIHDKYRLKNAAKIP